MTAEERRSLYEDVIQKIPMYDGLEHLFGQCERLLQYNPTALRFQDLKERKRKKNVMKKFRYHHANLFFTNLREVIVILQNLPDEWGVPFLDEYWSWHFHNLAEKLEHTLREIDWLPEHGKPPIRAPQAAIRAAGTPGCRSRAGISRWALRRSAARSGGGGRACRAE